MRAMDASRGAARAALEGWFRWWCSRWGMFCCRRSSGWCEEYSGSSCPASFRSSSRTTSNTCKNTIHTGHFDALGLLQLMEVRSVKVKHQVKILHHLSSKLMTKGNDRVEMENTIPMAA
jgi:hypothetical protein